jgi:uncharacterized protein
VVRVAERPLDGRANEAVLAALASALGVRRRDVAPVSGGRGRNKIVEVQGDDELLAQRVALLLSPADG